MIQNISPERWKNVFLFYFLLSFYSIESRSNIFAYWNFALCIPSRFYSYNNPTLKTQTNYFKIELKVFWQPHKWKLHSSGRSFGMWAYIRPYKAIFPKSWLYKVEYQITTYFIQNYWEIRVYSGLELDVKYSIMRDCLVGSLKWNLFEQHFTFLQHCGQFFPEKYGKVLRWYSHKTNLSRGFGNFGKEHVSFACHYTLP